MFEFITYNTVLCVHIFAFIVNILLVIVADGLALFWVTGKKEVLNYSVMKILHNLVWVGLSVSIISGFVLFTNAGEYLLTVQAFYTKMCFVLALAINSFVIWKHLHVVSERTFISLSKAEKKPLLISGVISTVSWVGVVVAAQFLGI